METKLIPGVSGMIRRAMHVNKMYVSYEVIRGYMYIQCNGPYGVFISYMIEWKQS